MYDITISPFIVPANMVISNSETALTYRKTDDNKTVTLYPTQPLVDSTMRLANTAFVTRADLIQKKTRRAIINSAATLTTTDYLVAFGQM